MQHALDCIILCSNAVVPRIASYRASCVRKMSQIRSRRETRRSYSSRSGEKLSPKQEKKKLELSTWQADSRLACMAQTVRINRHAA